MDVGAKRLDTERSSITAGESPGPEFPLPWRKIGLLALIVAGLLTLVYFSPLRAYLGRLHEVSQQVRSFGPWAPLGIVLGVAAMVAIGFPRLLFCFIAGMALGFWSGLLWAQLGTLLGNYALFIMARASGRDWTERLLSRRAHLHGFIQQRGILGVIVARQLPLPGLVINLACALLPFRHFDFVVGTLVGQLPQAIPCTLIGAGAMQPSFAKSISAIGLAIVAFALAWFVVRYLLRQSAASKPTI